MKKFISVLMAAAAAMVMSITSFAAEDAGELLDRVTQKEQQNESMDCRMGIHMDIISSELSELLGQEALTVNMEMRMKMAQITSGNLEFKADVAANALGESMYYTLFYKDGYYYTDLGGTKLKYPMDLDSIVKTAESATASMDLDSSYMKALSLREEDGLRILSFEADAKQLDAYVKDVMNTTMGAVDPSGLDDMQFSVVKMDGEYRVNEEDYITSAWVDMVLNMSVLDENVLLRMRMEYDVNNPGQAVTVDIPSTEGYQDLESYYAELFAGLESA